MSTEKTVTAQEPEVDVNYNLIITNDGAYAICPWEKCDYPDNSHAYTKDGYFYLLHGVYDEYEGEDAPGVYLDENDVAFLVEVSTDKEKEEHLISTHLADIHPESIINVLKVNKNLFYSFPESSKLFIPEITENDDILKRGIKLALNAKNIDIDSCKENFVDKNALFNFKQVIKGTSRLSILLFERGLDALNLKCTIILEEIDPENAIGTSLDDPEAVKNIIRNSRNTEPSNEGIDVDKELPKRFKNNFRTDKIDLNGKIVVSSTDTYDL